MPSTQCTLGPPQYERAGRRKDILVFIIRSCQGSETKVFIFGVIDVNNGSDKSVNDIIYL